MEQSSKDLARVYQTPSQKVLFAGVFIQALFFILHLSVGLWAKLYDLYIIGYTFLFGVIVWMMIWAHGFLKKKALSELQDNLRVESLKRDQIQSGKIFNQEQVGDGSFQQNLIRFERLIVPVVTGFLAMIYLMYAFYLDNYFSMPPQRQEAQNLVKTSAFLCSYSFLLTMAGLYFRQLGKQYLFVRGGATLLVLGAVLCGAQGLVLVLYTNDLISDLNWIKYISMYLPFFLCGDYIFSLLVSVLKPSHRGEERVVAYDLRLTRLFTSTGLTLGSLSDVLRFQFGFHISENWFASFFVKKLFPYILFLAVTAMLATSVVFIDSHEGGVLLTWGQVGGKENMKVLEPGAHFKLPWPFQTIKKFGQKQIVVVEVGHENHSHDEIPVDQLTTLGHYKESELFYLRKINAGNEYFEVVAISANFTFEADKDHLYEYIFGYQDLAETAKVFLRSELALFFSGLVIEKNITDGHAKWSKEFESKFFEKITKALPGVKPLRVSLTNIQYPAEMQESLRSVYSAEQVKRTTMMKAQSESTRIKELTDAYLSNIEVRSAIEVGRIGLQGVNDKKVIDNLRNIYRDYKTVFTFWEKKAVEENLLSSKDIDYIPNGVRLYLEDKSVKKNAIELFRD